MFSWIQLTPCLHTLSLVIRIVLAQRPTTLVLIMINSCSYSINDLVFIQFQLLIKSLIGAQLQQRGFGANTYRFKSLHFKDRIKYSRGVQLFGSRWDRVGLEKEFYNKTSICLVLIVIRSCVKIDSVDMLKFTHTQIQYVWFSV